MSQIVIRKILNEEERLAAIEAAKNDGDMMRFPTHVMLKDNKIVGAWCLGGIPLVMGWLSTKDIKARDSLVASNIVSSIMNDRNSPGFIIACNDHSPFMGHMERFGYSSIWATNFYYRDLRDVRIG